MTDGGRKVPDSFPPPVSWFPLGSRRNYRPISWFQLVFGLVPDPFPPVFHRGTRPRTRRGFVAARGSRKFSIVELVPVARRGFVARSVSGDQLGSFVWDPGSGIWDPGSRIQDLGSGIRDRGWGIWDPGSSRIQDLGSESGEIWWDLVGSGGICRNLVRSGGIWWDLVRSGEIW